MSLENIQGFKVLALQYSSSSTSCHNIFLKEHSVRLKEENKPPGRTLFIINIPPYVTETSLKHSFAQAGKIQNVIIEESEENYLNNDGFKRVYIVFNKRESLLKALKLNTLNALSSDEKPLKSGLQKWICEYNSIIQNNEKLHKEIKTFMAKYEDDEKNKSIEAVDNEGWTLVTKGGRRPGLSKKESVEKKLNDKAVKSLKKKELKNFYTFQIRESQMKKIAALRKNFEEDKNKVNLMKKARKFKPY